MNLPEDPLVAFAELLSRAKAAVRDRDHNAMVLSTVDDRGRPASRVVLLKEVDARGFTFFTNSHSKKGRELTLRPFAALNIHWWELEMQVRVEGAVETVSKEESDAYFASRARDSQLGAWASLQSEPLPDRAELLARFHEFQARFASEQVPRPPHWFGFRVVPDLVEFWRNQPHRLHERQLFTRGSPAAPWQSRALYP